MFKIVILFISIIFSNCSSLESEKSYCEKRADHYFTLCILNYNLAPNYFGKPEWNKSEIQAYSRNYCIAEYLRKKKCTDKSSIEPRKKTP